LNAPLPQISWSGHTDGGRYRSNNEDAFLALAFDSQEVRYLGKVGEGSLTEQDMVFAVSDGMGGENSGEFASKFATERITRLLPPHFRKQGQHWADALTELFQRIHQDIVNMGRSYEECRKMGATLTLAWLTGHTLRLGHVGDSRLYLLPKGGAMKQLSEDHTHVGHLYREGQINERELRMHPRRNVLNRALGSGQQFVDPQVLEVPISEGDRLLICSDGIMDGVWNHALADALSQGTSAPELVRHAILEGSRDNCTALILTL
jgi:PPM family protein phosphatase